MARIEENRQSGLQRANHKGTDAPSNPRREFLDADTDEEDFRQQGSPEGAEELPPEPQKPSYDGHQLNTLVRYAKELVPNAGELDWPEECDGIIREFFENPHHTTMAVFRDSTARWKITLGSPAYAPKGFIYFSRSSHWQIYAPTNFHQTVLFGSISADYARCIMRLMENTCQLCASDHGQFSQMRRNNFYEALDEILARLKKHVYEPHGFAIMYVPREYDGRYAGQTQRQTSVCRGGISCCKNAEEGRSVERLENVASRWVEEMHEASAAAAAELQLSRNKGTLQDQFRRWKASYSRLIRIRHQLDDYWLQEIIQTLEKLQRPIVRTFRNCIERIDDRLSESSVNLRYLAILVDEFSQSFDLTLNTDYFARRTLLLAFAVCAESPFRSSFAANAAGLCRALVSQMITQCRRYIQLDAILAGDAKSGINALEHCISCCRVFEKTYHDLKVGVLAEIEPHQIRQLSDDTIFHQLHTFVDRCYDVIYVCDAIMVFGGCDKLGTFPSANGTTYEARCRHIESVFRRSLREILSVQGDILDVTKPEWLQVKTRFRNAMIRLERMAANLIDVTFANARTVEEGAEALHALKRFRYRKYLNNVLREKYIRVWQIFDTEIENAETKGTYVDEAPAGFRCDSTLADSKIHQRYLQATNAAIINSLDWLADSPAAERTLLREKPPQNQL